jgi:hypothetical protein
MQHEHYLYGVAGHGAFRALPSKFHQPSGDHGRACRERTFDGIVTESRHLPVWGKTGGFG